MDMKFHAGALALMLALGAHEAAAETYRCQLGDRIVSYQQTPCAVPELPPPPPVASRPAPAEAPAVVRAAAPRAAPVRDADEPFAALTRRQREALDLTARLERCRVGNPEFTERSAEVYQAWRRRHARTLSDYRKLLVIKVRAASRVEAVGCTDEWLREMEALARAPDPRFGTVEQTWELFVRALQAADRATLMSCVTGPVERALQERLERLSDADLRRMGVNIRSMKVEWGDDYDKEGLVLHGERVDAVAFRSINEEWKIRALVPAAAQRATLKRSSPDS